MEFSVKDSGGYGKKNTVVKYSARLFDFREDMFIVAVSRDGEAVIYPEKNSKLEVYLYTDSGIYQADVNVKKTVVNEKIFLMALRLVSEPVKLQRRQHFRIVCALQADVVKMAEDEVLCYLKFKRPPVDDSSEKCTIIDISGGGAKLFSSFDMKIGEHVFMNFPMPMEVGEKEMEIMGEVIDIVKTDDDDCFESRVRFEGLTAELRDYIIKYVFEQQRIAQKRERGRKNVKENIDN